MSKRIHNVIIGLSGVQHVHAMLPAVGVNAFMVSLSFVASECASNTNLELLGTKVYSFLGWKREETLIQMGINGAEYLTANGSAPGPVFHSVVYFNVRDSRT